MLTRQEHEKIAIVLRILVSSEQKIVLFDQEYGKRIVSFGIYKKQHKLLIKPGVALTYFAQHKKQSIFIQYKDVGILYWLSDNISDITWYHTILEIIYYCMPQNQPDKQIFYFLRMSFLCFEKSITILPSWIIFKQVSLLTLLYYLGFFPPTTLQPFAHKWILLSNIVIHSDMTDPGLLSKLNVFLLGIPKSLLYDINAWITSCMQQHPHAIHFKALQFVF